MYFLEIKLRSFCGKSYTILASVKITGQVIEEIVSDGGEFHENNTARDILHKKGIKHTLTMPSTPEQIGVVKESAIESFL